VGESRGSPPPRHNILKLHKEHPVRTMTEVKPSKYLIKTERDVKAVLCINLSR